VITKVYQIVVVRRQKSRRALGRDLIGNRDRCEGA